MARLFRTGGGKSLAKALGQFYEKSDGLPLSKVVGILMSSVNLPQLDSKWLPRWIEITGNKGLNPRKLVKPDKNKAFYALSMFPYPSGELHIGHLRVYSMSDAISRYYRMNGYDVIHPMGFDAFGLPAENAAIERGINPEHWTRGNIDKMKVQMNQMFADFDWDKEVITCDEDYYHWTQKLFLLMFENKLAYRARAEINWDPIDNTVLANEQVDSEGRSWRSGAIVEKRLLEQWFLGITKFAPELNKDLQLLDDWPNKVKLMQKNWIGESKGAEINFKLVTSSNDASTIDVFTTRAETVYGVQYLALSFDHPIVQERCLKDSNLKEFIESTNKETDSEDSKKGYLLDGIKVVNPITNSEIPVFTAPYVIGSYGHGAVMGVPAHDKRDFDFWRTNTNGEDIIKVVDPLEPKEEENKEREGPFVDKEGIMNSNAGELQGLSASDARVKVIKLLANLNSGSEKTQYKIRDWLISRQRYWGAPIPIIHCESCGPVAVPDKDLPVKLPKVDTISKKGGSPLALIPEFVNCKCPECGKDAKRDTDTMDTFMDSSWYMFRYADANNKSKLFDKEKINKFFPVNLYIGGLEHAILHLLYTRFISKFLHQIGYWGGDKGSIDDFKGEPIKKLLTQGMVHGKSFVNPVNRRFLRPDEYDINEEGKAVLKENGLIADEVFEKMSKSKYNGADPGACIERHGADATRAHILFQAPVPEILDWDEDSIIGVERLFKRTISLSNILGDLLTPELIESERKAHSDYNIKEKLLHDEFQKSLNDLNVIFTETYDLNNIIPVYSQFLTKLTNAIEDEEVDLLVIYDNLVKLLKVMSPVAPATVEESYEKLHEQMNEDSKYKKESILASDWPQIEEKLSVLARVYKVFINGKFRFNYEKEGDGEIDSSSFLSDIKEKEEKNYNSWIVDESKVKRVIVKEDKMSIVLVVK